MPENGGWVPPGAPWVGGTRSGSGGGSCPPRHFFSMGGGGTPGLKKAGGGSHTGFAHDGGIGTQPIPGCQKKLFSVVNPGFEPGRKHDFSCRGGGCTLPNAGEGWGGSRPFFTWGGGGIPTIKPPRYPTPTSGQQAIPPPDPTKGAPPTHPDRVASPNQKNRLAVFQAQPRLTSRTGAYGTGNPAGCVKNPLSGSTSSSHPRRRVRNRPIAR